MVLVDTSVWVDHFRSSDKALTNLLSENLVLMHPKIAGELACGNLANRQTTLSLLDSLPKVIVATDFEASHFIESMRLYGLGIGFVDVHLLAACRLTGCLLWTRDRALGAVADKFGLRQPSA
jgi:predicted nucleic acid-binding protein